ncbi:class I SAM-dependent methyltransferase [Candidatus Pacearchaeota archaeon]|nr:class I SAM-dependent methyltransferase [Candidatus Pacearchaeota archaeon]
MEKSEVKSTMKKRNNFGKMRETILDKIIRWLRIRKASQFIPKNTVLIDMGCGEGVFLKKMRKRIKKGIGIDKKVKRNYENIIFIKADLENLKISKKADVITMLAVLEHIENYKELLKKSYKMLNKNGKIVITTPSKKSKNVLNMLANLKLVDSNEIKDHHTYFDNEPGYYLKKAGFKNIKHERFELGYNNLFVGEK